MKKKTILPTALVIASMVGMTSVSFAGADMFKKAASDFFSSSGATTTNSATSSSALANLSKFSNADVSSSLKEALKIGTETVVANLGKAGGFSADPKIRIPLPGSLQKASSMLKAAGMGAMTEDLENKINKAAEAATPKAKALFVDAISKMTLTDAKSILTGPNDSATQYLRDAMGAELSKEMQPIIQKTLSEAGAVQVYDQVVGQYSQIPFASQIKGNLNTYVVDKAMDGIFYYVAQQETAIRTNPTGYGTDMLQKVFKAVK